MLGAAVQDDIIQANPAAGVGRQVKIVTTKEAEPEKCCTVCRQLVTADEIDALCPGPPPETQ